VNSVVEAYCPIIKKHMNDSFTEEQKQWQQIRRGRWVHTTDVLLAVVCTALTVAQVCTAWQLSAGQAPVFNRNVEHLGWSASPDGCVSLPSPLHLSLPNPDLVM
jgi:hypothetical protein